MNIEPRIELGKEFLTADGGVSALGFFEMLVKGAGRKLRKRAPQADAYQLRAAGKSGSRPLVQVYDLRLAIDRENTVAGTFKDGGHTRRGGSHLLGERHLHFQPVK